MTNPLDKTIRIRTASISDVKALLDIYRPYVEKTAITFEYDVPSLEEFQSRIRHTLEKYPYLLAEQDGEILGYAYTSAFVGRAAYDWAAETSIYLRENRRHMGLGRKLYQALEMVSQAQNLTNLYACIGYPEREDEYLTNNSVEFHTHLGYRLAGEFRCCGYKFGRWYHMAWMEKIIGDHSTNPAPVIPYPDLKEEILLEIFHSLEK